MSKVVKVGLGLPWYAGPDRDCAANFLFFFHYLGRLQERLWWLAHGGKYGLDLPSGEVLPKLDPGNTTGHSEIRGFPPELGWPEFEFDLIEQVGCSLVGMARESIVDAALENGDDYLLFVDSDMLFGSDAFLRLYLDDKPVVAALAFTGREPTHPVIFKFDRKINEVQHRIDIDVLPVEDYERDALQQVDAVGSGMILYKTDVFRQIPKPWFTSTGCGEDIHMAFRCHKYGVPIYVDTRVKTIHKPTFHGEWHDERKWLKDRADLAKLVSA